MRGLAGAIAAALHTAAAPHTRRGRKSNRYPWGGGRRARFNTEADAARAVRRAKRWLRNQSTGPEQVPPAHIYANAEHAVAQYGDGIAN